MADDRSSHGFWVPKGSTILERYDEQLDGSRSSNIIDAMELQLVVEDVLDGADYGFGSEREKRHWIRQALLDTIRAERDR